ncbi:MAG: hypothetical protein WAQ99_02920 [Pyrinomonadaceae bacterium]
MPTQEAREIDPYRRRFSSDGGNEFKCLGAADLSRVRSSRRGVNSMESDNKLLKQIETLLNNNGNEALSAVRQTVDPLWEPGTGKDWRPLKRVT